MKILFVTTMMLFSVSSSFAQKSSTPPGSTTLPAQRSWSNPLKACSCGGTKSGYISVGAGGNRCECFIRPKSATLSN